MIQPSSNSLFQHTAARRRLAETNRASYISFKRFNTQPPEGGWRFGMVNA